MSQENIDHSCYRQKVNKENVVMSQEVHLECDFFFKEVLDLPKIAWRSLTSFKRLCSNTFLICKHTVYLWLIRCFRMPQKIEFVLV